MVFTRRWRRGRARLRVQAMCQWRQAGPSRRCVSRPFEVSLWARTRSPREDAEGSGAWGQARELCCQRSWLPSPGRVVRKPQAQGKRACSTRRLSCSSQPVCTAPRPPAQIQCRDHGEGAREMEILAEPRLGRHRGHGGNGEPERKLFGPSAILCAVCASIIILCRCLCLRRYQASPMV